MTKEAMDAGYADIENGFHRVAHGFGRQIGFFGNRYIRCTGRNNGNGPAADNPGFF
jgi:hypothetical protein